MLTASGRRLARQAALFAVLVFSAIAPAFAQAASSLIEEVAKQDYSPALRNVVMLAALSIVPVLLVSMTSFTRIVIVLAMLRHALGLPQTPPNSVIITLAICLTYFSMSPVIDRVNETAVAPMMAQKITSAEAMKIGEKPIRAFMISQTRESDLKAVLEMAHMPMPASMDEVRFSHLMPAFLLSELKTAFQIGFVIFLPFLLIDLVVAAALMALGMIMVPPATISLPLKILLFVLIDGWVLVSRSLLSSYWT